MSKRTNITLILFIFSFILIHAQSRVQSLDYYIHAGIINNPSLKDYQNQIASGHYDSLMVRLSRRPQVNAVGQLLAAPIINGYGYDEGVTNHNVFSAVISFSQDLLVSKTLKNQYNTIRLENNSIRNTSHLTERDLKRNISDQYVQVWATGLEIAFDNEMIALLKEQEQIVKQLATQALYNKTDYLTLQIEIQTQQINIKQKQLDYLQGLYDLNRLCGIKDTDNYSLAEPIIVSLFPMIAQALPFFEQFHIDSLKYVSQMEMTRLKYIPKLSWYADAGVINTIPSLIQKNFGFSAGLNFSMPLNSGRQKKFELEKIGLSEDTRAMYKDFFSKQYSMQVHQIKRQMQQTDSLVIFSERQIRSYKELIDADRMLMNKGGISVIDFIAILKNYISARNDLSALKAKRLLLINELNYWISQQ